jgi:copper resistance protein C
MTPARLRRVTAVGIPIVLWLVVVATPVFAHAELDTISPADKSSGPAPTEIVATFTEELDPSASNLKVVDSAGKVLVEGGTVDPTNKKLMRLSLSSTVLAPGAYTIRWQSKSADDGDLDRNTTSFTVTAAASPSVAPSVLASASAPPSASVEPSVAAPSPSPSGGTSTSTTSTDALIPIVAALVVIGLLGLWLLRGRGRRAA